MELLRLLSLIEHVQGGGVDKTESAKLSLGDDCFEKIKPARQERERTEPERAERERISAH